METRTLKEIADWAGGHLVEGQPALLVRRIATDSRRVQPDDLFWALAGDKFDGHDYAKTALEEGAMGVVINQAQAAYVNVPCPRILVDDTRKALGRFAARYRRDFAPLMFAVAGSNGKTTAKELLASVLRQGGMVLCSEASFNNDVGVPLTLLQLESSHGAAVLEAGTNHSGELAPLLHMIAPRFGLLTSIGREHLEFFGDLDGVVEEEGKLGELLPSDGCLLINGDTLGVERIVQRTRATVVTVGFHPSNTWRVQEVCLHLKGISFHLEAPVSSFSGHYEVPLLGRHQAVNAALAIVGGFLAGLSRCAIQQGLRECRPPKMRLQHMRVGGIEVLDDSYNANADSMLAALLTLHDLPCAGRRIAVLGEMSELGASSPAAHAETGQHAARLGIDALFTVGNAAVHLGEAARAEGLALVRSFDTVDAAAHALKAFVKPGDFVLLKASRAARLERIGELLRQ